jgi:biopolymer transport protein ExbD
MRIPLGQEEEAEFEMSPMIDMVFLLLIFFMIASRMSTVQNVKLEIPEADKAVVPKERPERFVVNIKADGTIFAGSRELGREDADVIALKNIIKDQKAAWPNLKLYLRADKETEHRYVKKVMGAMAEIGVDDFIFGAFKPTG